MKYVDGKTILSSYWESSDWFGTNYNLNLYRGCCHGCIYCDSRSECYHVEDFDTVKAKRDAITILENELRRRRKTGVVGFGAMSDPYNPFESELKLTRQALTLLDNYHFGVSMITKSNLVTRDIDVYKSIMEHSPVIVKVTITTPKDEMAKLIEPNAPLSSERFKAVNECSQNQLYAGVMMTPILPYITDKVEDIINMVKIAKDNGASFIFTMLGVTLRSNQREYFYKQLEGFAPYLIRRYISTYGNAYSCSIPSHERVYDAFQNECEKLDMTYKMEDIINGYKKNYRMEQLSFL